MIDLILLSSLGLVFFLGFKAGNHFKSIAEMIKAGLDKARTAL